jgi:hypothetical protein
MMILYKHILYGAFRGVPEGAPGGMVRSKRLKFAV